MAETFLHSTNFSEKKQLIILFLKYILVCAINLMRIVELCEIDKNLHLIE